MSEGYSQEEWNEIAAKVGRWIDEFFGSRQFECLVDSHKNEARGVIELFARYSYEYLGAGPQDWDRPRTRECCLEILPKKITAEPAFFKALAPVLSAFFNFLDASALLSQARDLSTAVAGLDREIVSAASDPGRWGPAKGFMMKAMAAGVDLGDQAAIHRFIISQNLQMAERLAPAQTASPVPSRTVFSTAPVPFHRPRPKVNRNDLCPCGSGKKFKRCCG